MKMTERQLRLGISLVFSILVIINLVSWAANAENVTENKTATTVSGCENLLTEMNFDLAQRTGKFWCDLKSGFKGGVEERGYDPFSLAFDLMVAGFGAVILLWFLTKTPSGIGMWVLYGLMIAIILVLLGLI